MQDLISTAREFCTWCRSEPEPKMEEARKALSLLVQLYSQALELDAPKEFDSDISSDRVDVQEWKEVYARASALPLNYYSSYFDPSCLPQEEHQAGNLADDIADIYRDVSAGLALFDAGHVNEAQWEFRFSFLTHWGRHASGAIRALHCWYADSSEL